VYFPSSPCVLHSPPTQPPLFAHPNNVWWRVHIMKLLIMQFFPSPFDFIYRRS
jgi:hypothetical protein